MGAGGGGGATFSSSGSIIIITGPFCGGAGHHIGITGAGAAQGYHIIFVSVVYLTSLSTSCSLTTVKAQYSLRVRWGALAHLLLACDVSVQTEVEGS